MRKPSEFRNHPVKFPANTIYRGVIKHVVDGDTVDILADLGLFHYAYITVRLRGIDAPEIFGKDAAAEHPAGMAAKGFAVEELLNKPVYIKTYKDRTSFGRFEADIYYDKSGTGVAENFSSFANVLRGFLENPQ